MQLSNIARDVGEDARAGGGVDPDVPPSLRGGDSPWAGAALAKLAEGNGAPDDLVAELRSLRSVDGPSGVMKELGGELGGPTPGHAGEDGPDYKDVDGPAFQVTDVQRYLKGTDYPADGKVLAEVADGNGAPADLIELLRGLRKVDGPSGVMHELKDHLGGPPS